MTGALAVAFLTGLVGAVHCAAMCGPLAVAGAAGGRALGYLGGRLASYAAVGAVLGAIGGHALCWLPVGTVQIVAVVGVAGFAVWRMGVVLRGGRPAAGLVKVARQRPGASFSVSLWSRIGARLPRGGVGLGLATGLLPCAMLLPAWTLAMAAGGAGAGAAVMVAFAAGSAPGLIAPMIARRCLRVRVPAGVQAAAWGLLAAWVIARPLLSAVHHH